MVKVTFVVVATTLALALLPLFSHKMKGGGRSVISDLDAWARAVGLKFPEGEVEGADDAILVVSVSV